MSYDNRPELEPVHARWSELAEGVVWLRQVRDQKYGTPEVPDAYGAQVGELLAGADTASQAPAAETQPQIENIRTQIDLLTRRNAA